MWRTIVLSGDAQANGQWMAIQDAFTDAFIKAGAPKGAAMYTTQFTSPDRVQFFFSPASEAIFSVAFAQFSASPCDEPASEDVTLLVGDDNARDTSWATKSG